MRLGMNMLLWTLHVTEEHAAVLADLKETGFDGAEIPIMEDDEKAYRATAKRLDALGLRRTAVTSLGPDVNPVSPDPAVRAAALARLSWALEMTALLGAERLVGPFHSAYAVFTGEGPTEQEKARCVEVLRAAAEQAATFRITLAVEPLNRFECYLMTTAAQGAEIVRRVDHENLVMLYDTHHMHIEEKNVVTAIVESGKTIGHVHVSENDRGVPGKGQVDWDHTFASLHEIGYDDWLVIESFSRLVPDFAAAIHIWRDFFGSPEEVYHEGHAFVRRRWA